MTYQLSHYLFLKVLVGSRRNPGEGRGCRGKETRNWDIGWLRNRELGIREIGTEDLRICFGDAKVSGWRGRSCRLQC